VAINEPPFSLTNKTITLVAQISEAVGRLTAEFEKEKLLRLRKVNRMRTVQGSLAIEGNTLSEQQITAILDGKHIIAPPKEVLEAHNAITAYEKMEGWQPANCDDLLAAHLVLMKGLTTDAGMFRAKGVGVMSGDKVVHMAPQADRVAELILGLLDWVNTTDIHPLIVSCVFHYEFEFIHPFSDGNGRMGRLWQTLILSKWHDVFVNIPVESLVHQYQEDYYAAIRQSTKLTDSSPFIEFMLRMILNAIETSSRQSEGLNECLNEGLNLSAVDKAILELIAQDVFITNIAISEKLTKSISTIERHIKMLKESNLLQRVGSKKTGHWKILK
jgi:Fic family protein